MNSISLLGQCFGILLFIGTSSAFSPAEPCTLHLNFAGFSTNASDIVEAQISFRYHAQSDQVIRRSGFMVVKHVEGPQGLASADSAHQIKEGPFDWFFLAKGEVFSHSMSLILPVADGITRLVVFVEYGNAREPEGIDLPVQKGTFESSRLSFVRIQDETGHGRWRLTTDFSDDAAEDMFRGERISPGEGRMPRGERCSRGEGVRPIK